MGNWIMIAFLTDRKRKKTIGTTYKKLEVQHFGTAFVTDGEKGDDNRHNVENGQLDYDCICD